MLNNEPCLFTTTAAWHPKFLLLTVPFCIDIPTWWRSRHDGLGFHAPLTPTTGVYWLNVQIETYHDPTLIKQGILTHTTPGFTLRVSLTSTLSMTSRVPRSYVTVNPSVRLGGSGEVLNSLMYTILSGTVRNKAKINWNKVIWNYDDVIHQHTLPCVGGDRVQNDNFNKLIIKNSF